MDKKVCQNCGTPVPEVQWRDLTDDEKAELVWGYEVNKYKWTTIGFIDAVIAKFKEANK